MDSSDDAKSEVPHPATHAGRTGRGSLAGRIALSDHWDTPEVNGEIARDFGLEERATPTA